MNTLIRKKIVELLTRRPKLRMSQISDSLDVNLEEIEIDVRYLEKSGALHSHLEQGANGIPVTVYYVNPGALAWGVLATVDKESSKIEKTIAGDKEPSKIDKAMAYLREHGTATPRDLSNAMGIDSKKYSCAQFLTAAIKNHRIIHEGNLYKLGSGFPAKSSSSSSSTPEAGQLVHSLSPTPGKIDLRKAKKPKAPATVMPSNAVKSSLSIGDMQIVVWRTGNLTIGANDNTVDLDPAQTRALTAFVGLMGDVHV